jgi:hypothetical protein
MEIQNSMYFLVKILDEIVGYFHEERDPPGINLMQAKI